MIGVFDYTVILTYLSLLSASIGIGFSLMGSGGVCPYYGIFCLFICGLLDGFDGKVASLKINRSSFEKKFGIQIDSLSDLVAFGILPACIGVSIIQNSSVLFVIKVVLYIILFFYVLAALIRLAYYNVTEEERQSKKSDTEKWYTGLPVTSSTLILPGVLLLQYIIPFDIMLLYFLVILGMSFAFLSKFKIKALTMKKKFSLVFLGAIEFFLLVFILFNG